MSNTCWEEKCGDVTGTTREICCFVVRNSACPSQEALVPLRWSGKRSQYPGLQTWLPSGALGPGGCAPQALSEPHSKTPPSLTESQATPLLRDKVVQATQAATCWSESTVNDVSLRVRSGTEPTPCCEAVPPGKKAHENEFFELAHTEVYKCSQGLRIASWHHPPFN